MIDTPPLHPTVLQPGSSRHHGNGFQSCMKKHILVKKHKYISSKKCKEFWFGPSDFWLIHERQRAWAGRCWSWKVQATTEAKWLSLILFYLLASQTCCDFCYKQKLDSLEGRSWCLVRCLFLHSPVALPALTLLDLLWCSLHELRVWKSTHTSSYVVWDGP